MGGTVPVHGVVVAQAEPSEGGEPGEGRLDAWMTPLWILPWRSSTKMLGARWGRAC